MSSERTIVMVLRSGGDFSIQDVFLMTRHILNKWVDHKNLPRIVCLWDKASHHYTLSEVEFVPLTNDYPGTWSRMQLYSPEMEQFRPFLYVDLDTAIIKSIENIFDLVKDESQFIALEDFFQKKQLATGLVWFPANSDKIKKVWAARGKARIGSFRMDYFLREFITQDNFWQNLTDTIIDFKPIGKHQLLTELPENANLVCFHGKPRISQATNIEWVKNYVENA